MVLSIAQHRTSQYGLPSSSLSSDPVLPLVFLVVRGAGCSSESSLSSMKLALRFSFPAISSGNVMSPRISGWKMKGLTQVIGTYEPVREIDELAWIALPIPLVICDARENDSMLHGTEQLLEETRSWVSGAQLGNLESTCLQSGRAGCSQLEKTRRHVTPLQTRFFRRQESHRVNSKFHQMSHVNFLLPLTLELPLSPQAVFHGHEHTPYIRSRIPHDLEYYGLRSTLSEYPMVLVG